MENKGLPLQLRLALEKEKDAFTTQSMIGLLSQFAKHIQADDKSSYAFIPNEEIHSVVQYLSKENLQIKVSRELNGEVGILQLKDPSSTIYTGNFPLGVILHILPSNSPGLCFYALVDGLLTGNANILKLSKKDREGWGHQLILALLNFSTPIKSVVAFVDSADSLYGTVDAVSAWGGDDSLLAIKSMVPPNVRFISWGHKISFAIIADEHIKSAISGQEQELFSDLSREMFNNFQLACSSPQTVLLQTENETLAEQFVACFAAYLENNQNHKVVAPLGEQELTEISTETHLFQLETFWSAENKTTSRKKLFQDKGLQWRLMLTLEEGLSLSPLYHTLVFKLAKSCDFVSVLSPFRSYLQTCGLYIKHWKNSQNTQNVKNLIDPLIRAGVNRIRPLGSMTDGEVGEPHDGEMGLARFVRVVSSILPGKSHGLDLEAKNQTKKIMDKSDFQSCALLKMNERNDISLIFKSGGSSGQTAYSAFTEQDYHQQMLYAARGLKAAGLDPDKDLCLNVFFGGGLYGGFLSFTTILEKLKAKQLPMAAWNDLAFVAETIVALKPNVILGMPSYIINLFRQQGSLLKGRNSIKKIFFGGEMFPQAEREFLKNEFGVELVASAAYGSVDAGPLGYQCQFNQGTIHHLHQGLHQFELVGLENDSTIEVGQVGRLLVTTPSRQAATVKRYQIGDIGRMLPGPCACGSRDSLFELKGRTGDIFKLAGSFINGQKIEQILIDFFNYRGEIQLKLKKDNALHNQAEVELLEIVLSDLVLSRKEKVEDKIIGILLEQYRDLREIVLEDQLLKINIVLTRPENMLRTPGSGKLRRIVDER